MGGLYNQLYLGVNALTAQRAGIANAGHNIANVNTTGHTRTTVDLTAEQPDVGGVRAGQIRGSHNTLLAKRERAADSSRARAEDLQRAYEALETRVADSDQSVIDSMAGFFGSLLGLASSPADNVLRSSVIQQGDALSNAFARAAAATREAVLNADDLVITYAQEAAELARRIAELNRELRATTNPSTEDMRNQAARELSELVGGSARIDPDGRLRFVLDDGTTLVHGDEAAEINTVADASLDGRSRIEVVSGNNVRDVTAGISSGRIGAQLTVRDEAGPEVLTELDQLAFDLVGEFNVVHQAHSGLDGSTGNPFFASLGSVSGAAENLVVNQAIKDNVDLLATAEPPNGPTDNSGVLRLLELTEQDLAGGGQRTFIEEGTALISRVGLRSVQSRSDFELATLQTEILANLRDALSGVSLEDELAHLGELQRASEATTRFIATVDELLGTMIRDL